MGILMLSRVLKLCEIIFDLKCLYSMLTWKPFSLTSYRMLKSLRKQGVCPNTIIDVGANIGQFSVSAANMFPAANIYSFEPLPDCYKKLKTNSNKYSNINVFQVALGNEKGSVEFNVNKHSHSSSILSLSDNHKKSFPAAEVSHVIDVEIDTLDSVLVGIDLVSPVMLKIDVQGYEGLVLDGLDCKSPNIDLIILESSFKPMYEGELLFMDIIEKMKLKGFEFDRPVGWLESEDTGEIVQMDMLFCYTK